jgi:hypothetical protein
MSYLIKSCYQDLYQPDLLWVSGCHQNPVSKTTHTFMGFFAGWKLFPYKIPLSALRSGILILDD